MLRAAETASRTDTGRQRRDNEDSLFVREPVFVIADGMGGAQAGEVASRMAVEMFQEGLPDAPTSEERLAGVVQQANRRIHERSQAEEDRHGMGTTLTAALLDERSVAIAHVGDSRAYLFRAGELSRLTQDHSLVAELVRRGKLTESQAEEHPQRSIITRALGIEPWVEVDTWSYPARAGDVLLLCSDGLTSMITEGEIASVLRGAPDLDAAAAELISEANRAGGRDNITVILTRLEEVDASDSDPPTLIAPPGESIPSGAATPVETAPPAIVSRPAADGVSPRGVEAVSRRDGRDKRRRPRGAGRLIKPLAALSAVAVVVVLILAGGYLATRQLYFIGTNGQGIVTIYRGLPYDLPAGVHLYETYYVSGVPAALIPTDRRARLLNHGLRSQSDAQTLVTDLELGRINK